jgi:hypothetical protein
MVNDKTTVLEGIINDVGVALYQRWANEVPESSRTPESNSALAENASQTAFFVVQMFMDKFNEAAEQLSSTEKE